MLRLKLRNDDELYRHIHPHFFKEGRVRSPAFALSDDGVSVDLARLTTLERFRARRPNNGVAGLTVAAPISVGLAVVHKRCIDPGVNRFNAAHCLMRGLDSWDKKKKISVQRELARIANQNLIVRPTV